MSLRRGLVLTWFGCAAHYARKPNWTGPYVFYNVFEVAALNTNFFLERVFAHAMIWQVINEKPITKTTKLTLSFRRASADRAGEPPRGVAFAETCPEFV